MHSFVHLGENEIDYKLFEDWDTVPIKLYDILEMKVKNEQFQVHETVDSLIPECQLPYNRQRRVSPGGGPMISQRVMEGVNFNKSIKMLSSLQDKFEEFSEDIKIYV